MSQSCREYDIFQEERKTLITELRTQGIDNETILEVMQKIPRHLFVDNEFSNFAYENRALPISDNQTISQPYIVAYMTQVLLATGVPKKVLEVGTGSGYQTAVLASIVPSVFTVERIAALQSRSRRLLRQLNFHNVHFRCADGCKGWRQYAPFDCIIVTAAAKEFPDALVDQLIVGGKLLCPVGGDQMQNLILVERTKHHIKKQTLEAVKFVPLIS